MPRSSAPAIASDMDVLEIWFTATGRRYHRHTLQPACRVLDQHLQMRQYNTRHIAEDKRCIQAAHGERRAVQRAQALIRQITGEHIGVAVDFFRDYLGVICTDINRATNPCILGSFEEARYSLCVHPVKKSASSSPGGSCRISAPAANTIWSNFRRASYGSSSST